MIKAANPRELHYQVYNKIELLCGTSLMFTRVMPSCNNLFMSLSLSKLPARVRPPLTQRLLPSTAHVPPKQSRKNGKFFGAYIARIRSRRRQSVYFMKPAGPMTSSRALASELRTITSVVSAHARGIAANI